MKVKASLKLACQDCFYVRRGKNLYIRCTTNPRHKRRQGFSTLNMQPTTKVDKALVDNLMPKEHGPTCHHCKKVIAAPLSLFKIMEIQEAFKKQE